MMNANWLQIAMLAYNLDCWLQLFSREENLSVDAMKHTTLATARLRFLFLGVTMGLRPTHSDENRFAPAAFMIESAWNGENRTDSGSVEAV
jgi:hypothetical protein